MKKILDSESALEKIAKEQRYTPGIHAILDVENAAVYSIMSFMSMYMGGDSIKNLIMASSTEEAVVNGAIGIGGVVLTAFSLPAMGRSLTSALQSTEDMQSLKKVDDVYFVRGGFSKSKSNKHDNRARKVMPVLGRAKPSHYKNSYLFMNGVEVVNYKIAPYVIPGHISENDNKVIMTMTAIYDNMKIKLGKIFHERDAANYHITNTIQKPMYVLGDIAGSNLLRIERMGPAYR